MRKTSKLIGLCISLVLFVILGTVWLQRQSLYDWLRLRDYQPTAAIVQLATDTSMDDYARHVFYVQRPTIEDKASFNNRCRDDEQTIVLGCYITGIGIYILGVNDPRLGGVEQVTAAHEMLHATYDRLSKSEKKRVNNLLDSAYKALADERIKAIVEEYSKADADILNELHSILGTEVRNLPTELETYYKQYFINRQEVVNFSEKYQRAFSDRKALADSYQARIEALSQQLGQLRTQLDITEGSINNEYNQLERERSAATDPVVFNTRVDAYNARAQQYRDQIARYNQLAAEHNQLLKEFQNIALEENELLQAIDSRTGSVPTQ